MPPRGYRSRSEVEIKKSRFITTLSRVDTESEARDLIAEVRSTFPDARHNCMAFILDDGQVRTARSSDDGEPSGTGGVPMMNALIQADIVNIVAVVTRYFGGIKLGASGLARAYGGSVADGVATMDRVTREVHQIWAVDLTHALSERTQEELRRAGATLIMRTYGETGVRVRFTIGEDPVPVLGRILGEMVLPIADGCEVVEVPSRPGDSRKP